VLLRARGLLRSGDTGAALGFLAGQLEDGRTPYRVAMAARELLRIAAGGPLRRRRHWYPRDAAGDGLLRADVLRDPGVEGLAD
jgi:hypothetical protein